jgi:hypothetical protein
VEDWAAPGAAAAIDSRTPAAIPRRTPRPYPHVRPRRVAARPRRAPMRSHLSAAYGVS